MSSFGLAQPCFSRLSELAMFQTRITLEVVSSVPTVQATHDGAEMLSVRLYVCTTVLHVRRVTFALLLHKLDAIVFIISHLASIAASSPHDIVHFHREIHGTVGCCSPGSGGTRFTVNQSGRCETLLTAALATQYSSTLSSRTVTVVLLHEYLHRCSGACMYKLCMYYLCSAGEDCVLQRGGVLRQFLELLSSVRRILRISGSIRVLANSAPRTRGMKEIIGFTEDYTINIFEI